VKNIPCSLCRDYVEVINSCEKEEKRTKSYSENMKEKNNLENQDVDGHNSAINLKKLGCKNSK
jgi:hypothetical protein